MPDEKLLCSSNSAKFKASCWSRGSVIERLLHNHHKMPPCQHRQRDGQGWSTLEGGGQPSERWSWMVYTGGGVWAALSLLLEGSFKVNDPEEVTHNSATRHGSVGLYFHAKETAFISLVSRKESFLGPSKWPRSI